jgi:replicative DNA helicase
VSVNVTLSIDEEILERARKLASQRGTSVNQMIRDYLESLTSETSREDVIAELRQSWATSAGNSEGQRWTREEIHERSRIR